MIGEHEVSDHYDILLVEDNPTDVLITREALTRQQVQNPLRVVSDGAEALRYLRGEAEHEGARLPGLIILDLNLPRRNGREVLKEIKSDARLRYIPVVILTTSTADDDIVHAYGLNANCYVVKPVDFLQYSEIVRYIDEFWLQVATLPPRGVIPS